MARFFVRAVTGQDERSARRGIRAANPRNRPLNRKIRQNRPRRCNLRPVMDPVIFLSGADTPFGKLMRAALLRRGCPVAAMSGGKLKEEPQENLLPLSVQDGDTPGMADAVAETLDRFGRIDALLHVPDAQQPEDGWRDFDFNLDYIFRTAVARPMGVARAILPVFRGQGGGVIGQVVPPHRPGVFPSMAWEALKAAGGHALGAAVPARMKMKLQVKIHEPGADEADAYAERIASEMTASASATRSQARGSISASQYRWILDWRTEPQRHDRGEKA